MPRRMTQRRGETPLSADQAARAKELGVKGAIMRSLHLDASKCTGCMQCEMACSYENYGVFNPSKSRIKVFDFHETGRKVP
jgi:Fe-S-cluster-containing dehydrogenase component